MIPEENTEDVRGEIDAADEQFFLIPMKKETPINCKACGQIFVNPRIGFPCGCTYCEKCKDSEACPICFRWVEHEVGNVALVDTIDSMRVRCCNHFDDPAFDKKRAINERCGWLLLRGDREKHEKECGYRWKRCPHLGCDEVYLMKEAEFHEKDCTHAETICPICGLDKELDFCCGQKKVKCGFENCDWYGFEVYSVNHRNNCLFAGIDAETKARKKIERRFKENYRKRKTEEKTKSYGSFYGENEKHDNSWDEFYFKREPKHRTKKSNMTAMSAMSESGYDNLSTISAPVYNMGYSNRERRSGPSQSIARSVISGRAPSKVRSLFGENAGVTQHPRFKAHEPRFRPEEARIKSEVPRFKSHEPSSPPTLSGSSYLSDAGAESSRDPLSSPTDYTFRSADSPLSSTMTMTSTTKYNKKVAYSFDLRLMKFLRKELGKSGLPYLPNGGVDPLALVSLSMFKRWNPTVQSFIDIALSDRRRYGTENVNGITYIRANYGHDFPVT